MDIAPIVGSKTRARPNSHALVMAWKPGGRKWAGWQDRNIRLLFGEMTMPDLMDTLSVDEPAVIKNRAYRLLPLEDYLARAKAYHHEPDRMSRRARLL